MLSNEFFKARMMLPLFPYHWSNQAHSVCEYFVHATKFLLEKIQGEGTGETRHSDAITDQTLRDRGAKETRRFRNYRGRCNGDQTGYFYFEIRAD